MAVPLMETNPQILKAVSICALIAPERAVRFDNNKTLITTYLSLMVQKTRESLARQKWTPEDY